MLKRILLNLFLLFTPLVTATSLAVSAWTPLRKGLSYTSVTPYPLKHDSNVIAFKIDPLRYRFRAVLAKALGKSNTEYVPRLSASIKGLIGINGGYFSSDEQPLGLRIDHFKQLSKFKKISWWGVFYLRNNEPNLVASHDFSSDKHISFAVQAGPRLVINNQVPTLKAGVADRSAIGMTEDKHVVIAITQNLALTLTQWALILKKLGCKQALNLDGGSSSQLYVNLNSLRFVIPNFKAVTDAVVITE